MPDHIDRIIDLSLALHRVIHKHASDSYGSAEKVNSLHIHALLLIGEQQAMTMSELARRLMISPSSATSFVARLHRLGLISRVRDTKNRKIVRLRLTPRGKALMHKTMEERRRMLKSILGKLPSTTQESFAGSLTQVIDFFTTV